MSYPFQTPEVRVVEASAGSGKTSALAKRYVQLLLHTSPVTPLAFKHILAITFTNKAANEMKGRIIDLLKGIALGSLPAWQEEDVLEGLDKPKARQAAMQLMGELIRHYHFFQVQTIDSFMNTLLAGCAFKINLSARFKIKRNAADYLQLSLDELIDESYGNKDLRVMLESFVRQYLFLENRSGWFPKKDLLVTLNTLFNQYNTYQLPLLTFPLTVGDVVECKKRFIDLLSKMQTILPEKTDKRFKSAVENFLKEHTVGFDVDDVSRYFGREQCPLTGGAVPTDELASMWQNARALLRAICLQEAYAVFNPYVDLFHETLSYFTKLQNKEDVLFLQQLNQKAGALFDDELVTVEELYYRLATRFHHYLMDEFQDTSAAQWHNLRLMVEESLSVGGTLFYVGDKKQAIYSFRGGKSALFDQLQGDFSHFNVTHEVLERNFRSHRQIVIENNRIFQLEHLKRFMLSLQDEGKFKDKDIVFDEGDWQRLEHVFGSGQQLPREELDKGLVSVEWVGGRRKHDRLLLTKERVLALVKDAHTRFAYRDIAILTRNNAQVQMITQWLVEEGIFAQSERTSDVKNHPLIKEIVALLRFIHRPDDNVSFTDFVLGDIFPRVSQLSPADIQAFLFSMRLKKQAKEDLSFYQGFRDVYPDIVSAFFADFLNRSGVYPLYELAVGILTQFRCLEFFPESQGFMMHFLELIKRREEDSCDLEMFLTYFDGLEDEERFVPMPMQDAVRVLTVHKSKGLEFAVVIIPFLEMSIKAGSGDGDGGQSFTWDIDDEGMRLLRLKESYARFADELRDRYAKEYKESLFSELNSIYVALTRAIWEMYVLVPERVGNSANPVALLMEEGAFQRGEAIMPALKAHKVQQRRQLPKIAQHPWITQIQEEFLAETALQSEARFHGQMLHDCLSHIGNLKGADRTKVMEEAINMTAIRFGQRLDVKRIEDLLMKASWRKFFELPQEARVVCEQEIVNAYGDTRRLDRVIIFPNEVWVVDFKTSSSDKADHARQIKEYEGMLSDLYPGRKVSGHLLYLDQP